MPEELIYYLILILTPIIFSIIIRYTLRKSILYNKNLILSRFSFFKYLRKNKIKIAAYLEMGNFKNELTSFHEKDRSIIINKIIGLLKKYCIEYNFNLFYFSEEKYVLVNKNTNMNYHNLFELLIKRLTTPIKLENEEFTLSVNIGAVTGNSIPNNPEELLDIIISSCHIAKNRNANYYLIMDLDNPTNVEKSYGLDDSGAIITHYMSLYDTKKVKIVGCETLARWKNKEKVLSPNVFIPLAIKRNLISNIDFQIAEDAFKNYLVLLKKNLIDEDFIVTINVAKESLTDSYIKRLENLINRYKEVPVKNILIDLDMEVFKDVNNEPKLLRLQEIGFNISMDGITFNFDELKEIHKRIPYNTIKVTSNHSLKPEFKGFKEFLMNNDVQIIATRIEKVDELHALINSELNLVQGFLYGKPSKFDAFVEQIWSNNVFRV